MFGHWEIWKKIKRKGSVATHGSEQFGFLNRIIPTISLKQWWLKVIHLLKLISFKSTENKTITIYDMPWTCVWTLWTCVWTLWCRSRFFHCVLTHMHTVANGPIPVFGSQPSIAGIRDLLRADSEASHCGLFFLGTQSSRHQTLPNVSFLVTCKKLVPRLTSL